MVAPRADDRGDAGDRAHGHSSAVMALHAVVEPDERRLLAGEAMGELFDRFDVHAGDRGDLLGGVLIGDAISQLEGADRRPLQMVRFRAETPQLREQWEASARELAEKRIALLDDHDPG